MRTIVNILFLCGALVGAAAIASLTTCIARAEPADAIEYRRLATVGGNTVGYFDHGSVRCYLTGSGGLSCVQRKP